MFSEKNQNIMFHIYFQDAYLSGHSCDNEARIEGPYLTTISQESLPFK